jgi:hypothetical protein
MMNIIRSMTMYRALGIILVIVALLGYIFVADELRHTGEFLGVTCILFAGFILIAINTKFNVFNRLAIQWVSLGLLISIPVGGIVLDNMPLGITICASLGIISAFVFRKNGIKS